MPSTRHHPLPAAAGLDAADRPEADRPEIVFVTDCEGTIVDVNDTFVEETGYTRAEAVGCTPRLLRSGLHGDEVYVDLWRTIQSGDVWEGELVDRRRDGSLRTHRVTITPVVDGAGRVARFVAVERDLTAELDRDVAGGTGLVHTDPDGRCVYADDRAGRLLGRAWTALLGDGLLGNLVPEDAHEVREVIGMAVDTGRPHRLDVRTSDGRWLRLTVGRLRAGSGAPLGARLDLEDISDRVAGATDDAGVPTTVPGPADRPVQDRSTRQSASRRSSRAPWISSAS